MPVFYRDSFYFTYEELKRIAVIVGHFLKSRFLLYLWGIETNVGIAGTFVVIFRFYFTYEELKPAR